MKCPQCNHKQSDDLQFCQKCLTNLHAQSTVEVAKDGRFMWLLNERKWHEDIRMRRRAPDGSIVRMPDGVKPKWER